ncbi:MAG: translocation/assembly module TamB domain-containing protein [Selenomonadaceae bacterium]|nr:translocation/assembly module TamB domain-containing protein [Selenomonadaceae bacterium]
MNVVAKALTGFLTGTIMLASAGAGYLYSQRDAVIEKIAATASDYISESLGTKVEIGSIEVGDINTGSISDIKLSDLAVYDKHSDLIAKAKSAEVNFHLLTLASDPLSAIEEIKVHGVEGNVVKRSDNTWNFSDLQTSSEGESNFDTNILIDNIKVNASFDGNEVAADVPNLKLDFDTTADFTAEVSGAKVFGNVEDYAFDTGDITGTLDFDHDNIKADVNADDISANINDSELIVDKINAALNLDEYSNVKADVKVQALGSNVQVTANVTDKKQIVNLAADTVDVSSVLPFIPDDTIPAGVAVLGGFVNDAKVNVLKRGDNLSFSGSASLKDGSVMVEQTQINDINGHTTFTDAEILLDASAQANGQRANVSGSIRIDTDEPYFDLKASSDSFSPNAVMYLPAEGSASFTAHLTGTPSNPIVEADIYSPYIAYEDISVSNVSTHLKYQDNAVYFSNIKADTFGGTVSGDFELMAMDLSFNAHLNVNGVNISRFSNYAPVLAEIDGLVFGDIGINGIGNDLDALKVYGSVTASNVKYKDVEIIRADTSFYVEGDDVKIDYLSATLPEGGTLGVEGTITDTNKLDLMFYAAHVDLSIAKNFVPQVNISGLADIKGSVHGNAENPNVDIEFSAVNGSKFSNGKFEGILLDQPYDSISFAASGSLDGIEVRDFVMSKNGKDVWLVKGTVGLTGEKNVNLQIDTVGARAETIVQLAAPDQPLTGNVDNIITVTGTLDNPHVVGYIEFSRGSYRGILVNSMKGDYFVEGNQIRLQDFRITSPMVDMVLNGIIDSTTTEMNFTVDVNDINVERFKSKLPENYPASGHGKFIGIIGGTLDQPIFDGKLNAESLSFNDVEISNVDGHISLNGDDILLDNFSFNEGKGSYTVHGRINYITNSMSGHSEVKNADIPNLLALANLKNDIVTGTLNSSMTFGGTLQNPSFQLVGNIPLGTVAGCDIHDINIDVNLLNSTLYIRNFEGFQGETGTVNASGSAQLNGVLDIKLNASNLALEMFSKAAGSDAEVVGTTSVEAVVGGTTDNPTAQVDISANGGLKGSTFDLLRGSLNLKDGVIDVEELIVQKAIVDKIYQISARGQIPLIALTKSNSKFRVPESELNLDISLDNADLSLLPLLNKNLIAWGIGEMAGNLKVTGTASDPLINGNILIKEGTTKIKGMNNLIEHMNMNLAFTGKEMKVEEFSGNIGKGKYELIGGLSIKGLELNDYKFTFTANNLEIISKFFSGPLNAEFSLSKYELKDPRGEHRGFRPLIDGHLDLDKCTISIPSIPESEGELPNIQLNVLITLGDKVHLYSPYLFDLYMTGNAKFEGSTNRPRSSGLITAKRGGTVSYLKTVFNVREGELQFQTGSFFPAITFLADTKITKTKVILSVGGVLNDRSIKLTSEPPGMTETEIMQLLTLRDAYQKGGDNDIETGDLLMLGLQMSFLSEIEGAVRKTTGFDQFSISRGSGSAFDNKSEIRERHEEEYNVTIGKYVTDNTMLKYTRGIGGDNINRYGLQYDINSFISATVEREGHAGILGFEARWKF